MTDRENVNLYELVNFNFSSMFHFRPTLQWTCTIIAKVEETLRAQKPTQHVNLQQIYI